MVSDELVRVCATCAPLVDVDDEVLVKRLADSINHKTLREKRRNDGLCTCCGAARENATYLRCSLCRITASLKRAKGGVQKCSRCGDAGHTRENCAIMRAFLGLLPVVRPLRRKRTRCECGQEKHRKAAVCRGCYVESVRERNRTQEAA